MKNVTQNWETPDIAPPPGRRRAGCAGPAARDEAVADDLVNEESPGIGPPSGLRRKRTDVSGRAPRSRADAGRMLGDARRDRVAPQ